MSLLLFLFASLGNLWIWKIFSNSIWLGLLLLSSSALLILAVFNKRKLFFYLFLIFFLILFYFQYGNIQKRSLTELNNYSKYLVKQRLNEYPPTYLKIAGKTLWLPLPHWLEQRKETISFYRFLENFSEKVDPNYYFFANHPRQRIGIKEFEKIPYFFLPFFVAGFSFFVSSKISKGKKLLVILVFVFPVLVFSFLGRDGKLGYFIAFPFMVFLIFSGLKFIFLKISSLSTFKRIFIVSTGFVFWLLNMIQIFLYEKF